MNKIFKKFSFMMVIGLATTLITGCAKKPDKNQIVAQVNNYQITIADFRQEAIMNLPGASKEEILQNIIAKELLLQEAQKMNLDKDELFMKEIENYWKQSLIKRLINVKGSEFLAMSKNGKTKTKMEVAQILLDQWINDLKANAVITKNDAVYNSIKLKNTDIRMGGENGK